LNALTPLASSPDGSNPSSNTTLTIDSRKEAFTRHTTEYFTLVKKVGEALHKQAAALDDAGISVGESLRGENTGAEVANGWIGNLDVGWLNSRTRDVGAAKEAELWEQARTLLSKLEESKNVS
jgi:hypothetical protein